MLAGTLIWAMFAIQMYEKGVCKRLEIPAFLNRDLCYMIVI